MEPAYTLSEKQLRDFLAQLVEEGKLDFDGSCCLVNFRNAPRLGRPSSTFTDAKA